MRLVELSHPLEHGMRVYPGLDPPRFEAVVDHEASRPRYDGKAEFYLGRIEMACNTGTYVDSPFHRFRDGADLSRVPLEDLAGVPGIVVEASRVDGRAVTIEADPERLRGRAVLIRTGWDERWGTDAYWEPGPFVSEASLELLLGARPRLVGVDFWNVDDTVGDPGRGVHTALLGDGILVVEHLRNLSALPETGFRFYAVPLRIVGGASMSVRAFAEVEA